MKAGISTACYFGKLLVEDTFEAIKKAGVSHAEVFLNAPSEYEDAFTSMLRERADKNGISIDSVHPVGMQYELQLFSTYARAAEDARNMYRKVLRAASRLGAKYYIFHGGMFLKPLAANQLNFKNVGKNVDLISTIAADYGISFAYENVYWCWYAYPEFAERLLNETKNPNLRFNLDIKQAQLSGRTVEDYIAYMGDRLCNVHICGLEIEGKNVSTCMPGKGNYDLGNLKTLLQKQNYDGNVIIEVYAKDFETDEDMKNSYEFVKELFEGRNSSI